MPARSSAAAPRRSGDDKRTAILNAALGLFGRYGYRRTAMDDVAREAGIAKGTVYLYFDTKESLFRALSQAAIDRVLAAARDAAATRGPIGERLLAVLLAKFGYFHEVVHGSPHARELLDSKNRLCADLFAEADRVYLQLLVRVLADATRRGEIAPKRLGLGPETAAELLVCGAHGCEDTPDTALFRRRLDALVRVVAAGLAAD